MLEMLVGLATLTPADAQPAFIPIELPQFERPLIPCEVGAGDRVARRLAPPLRPMPAISSPFGPRWGRLHAGVDFPAPVGTPVYAVADGIVVRASSNPSFGNVVVLRLVGGGAVAGDHVLYAHLHAIDVAPGQTVRAGERLGRTGNTGRSSGPHLHFSHLIGVPEGQVRRVGPMGFRERDHAVDPMPLLRCATGVAGRPDGQTDGRTAPFTPPLPRPHPDRHPGFPPTAYGTDPALRGPAADGSFDTGRPETRSQ